MNINKEITELKNDLYDSHKDAWLKAVTDLQNQMEQLKHDNEILREAVEKILNMKGAVPIATAEMTLIAYEALEKIKDDSLIKR